MEPFQRGAPSTGTPRPIFRIVETAVAKFQKSNKEAKKPKATPSPVKPPVAGGILAALPSAAKNKKK